MDQYSHSQAYTTFPPQYHLPTPIYRPIQSLDLYRNYSTNSQLSNQFYPDVSVSNNQSQIIEQSSINQVKYKWMEIKRAPPKISGIDPKYSSVSNK